MAVFIVTYDYTAGATFFAIEAASAAEIVDALADISVIAQPEQHPHLTPDILQRVRNNVRTLSDPIFDTIRKTP